MGVCAEERDAIIGWSLKEMHKRPWYARTRDVVRENMREDGRSRDGAMFYIDWRTDVCRMGVMMTNAAEEMRAITEAVEDAKGVLNTLADEARDLTDKIEPELLNSIKRVREARMTLTNEVRDALVLMREVRKFFLESDYATEVARVHEFVGVCKELAALRDNGVLDAVSDTILKLAVGSK